ncbi:peptidoglycan-binding LysM domain-containing protein [Perilla frutescens var. hirtella]|uniref:Peptidoglycan-binding LysM domain-containing protein n=1 Tax=Perilla frutescens var. hirtella TaxID=608512 RepID=A0AAD4JMT2_PERFH|nr:peptidoglycan-binding LysM domain-containing protein [Perilla frutescens var. hirtella]KAH6835893.1 peptidoglycan-binding LysM domain-containing protein [Perilla frutescens var. hirtella]
MNMAGSRGSTSKFLKSADASCWYGAVVLVTLILLAGSADEEADEIRANLRQQQLRPCDEIYVVGEGETLHTISEKCGDPFIVDNNPHIHDPDDVFPGLLIKITPISINS